MDIFFNFIKIIVIFMFLLIEFIFMIIIEEPEFITNRQMFTGDIIIVVAICTIKLILIIALSRYTKNNLVTLIVDLLITIIFIVISIILIHAYGREISKLFSNRGLISLKVSATVIIFSNIIAALYFMYINVKKIIYRFSR